MPLGLLCGARSGDKGGNANVGFSARDERSYAWLAAELTTARLRELLPEAAGLAVRQYELPNILALNFVVAGLIAPGVAATARPDAQAKGLGEYLRSLRPGPRQSCRTSPEPDHRAHEAIEAAEGMKLLRTQLLMACHY